MTLTDDPAAVPVSTPMRCLVVDDATDLRALIRLVLDRAEDFEVIAEAGDGRTAVDLAAEHRPDVVLLDIAMPVLDGLQAIPLVRRVSPASLVVVLSGFGSDSSAAQKALELGAHGFLNKLDTRGQLVDRLRVIASSHRAVASWTTRRRAAG